MTKKHLLLALLALASVLGTQALVDMHAEEDMLREPVEGCDMRGVCEYSEQYKDEHYQAWYKSQGYE